MKNQLNVLDTQSKMDKSPTSNDSKMTASQKYEIKREQTVKALQLKAIETKYQEGESVNPRDILVQTGIEDLKNGSRH
jgi:hypothetical protein